MLSVAFRRGRNDQLRNGPSISGFKACDWQYLLARAGVAIRIFICRCCRLAVRFRPFTRRAAPALFCAPGSTPTQDAGGTQVNQSATQLIDLGKTSSRKRTRHKGNTGEPSPVGTIQITSTSSSRCYSGSARSSSRRSSRPRQSPKDSARPRRPGRGGPTRGSLARRPRAGRV
jgi:hypothetical protein